MSLKYVFGFWPSPDHSEEKANIVEFGLWNFATLMAKHNRSSEPMDLSKLREYRLTIAKMKDDELARQYRWLHRLLILEPGEPTPTARIVQEFVQVWREAHRRGRITPLPKVR